MSLHALNRWLLVQASLWTSALTIVAWRAITGDFASLESWLYGLLALLSATSFAGLWRVLGVAASPANLVTLVRFLGLAGVCVALALQPVFGLPLGVTWGIWIALALVVLGDLLDGWMARRFGSSEEGAILDMETDQFTLIVLAVVSMISGAGPWPLIVPEIRYLFILAMTALGIPRHDPKPCEGDNRRGRLVCALVTVLLLCGCMPGLALGARLASGWVAVAALAASYAGDVRFLLGRARAASN